MLCCQLLVGSVAGKEKKRLEAAKYNTSGKEHVWKEITRKELQFVILEFNFSQMASTL